MAKYMVLVGFLVAEALAAPKIDSSLGWRVVGGSDAPEGEYPHQIILQYFGSFDCGGSIINKNYVVTAAHCVSGDPAKLLTVIAGTNQLDGNGVTYQVEEVHMHEDYDPWVKINDVAILKVAEITFTDKIAPIIVETEDVGGDEPVILSGWGRTESPYNNPNNLQHINLATTTVKYCNSRHILSQIIETHICTLTQRGEGACTGDSGGPLIRTVGDIRKLVGIVSWGRPCAKGVPDVYTRVSSFVGWLNDKCNNCVNYNL